MFGTKCFSFSPEIDEINDEIAERFSQESTNICVETKIRYSLFLFSVLFDLAVLLTKRIAHGVSQNITFRTKRTKTVPRVPQDPPRCQPAKRGFGEGWDGVEQ